MSIPPAAHHKHLFLRIQLAYRAVTLTRAVELCGRCLSGQMHLDHLGKEEEEEEEERVLTIRVIQFIILALNRSRLARLCHASTYSFHPQIGWCRIAGKKFLLTHFHVLGVEQLEATNIKVASTNFTFHLGNLD